MNISLREAFKLLKRFKSFLMALCLFVSFFSCGNLTSFAKEGKKAVIYVTSMLSSTLSDKENDNKILWLDSILNFLWDPNAVGCDENGDSINKNVVALNSTKDIKDENKKNLIKYGVNSCDKNIMDKLTNEFGPNTKFNCDVVRFAYDWRKSCEEISEGLLDVIKDYDSVYFVSYSQGGIIVSSALNKLLEKSDHKTLNKVKSCIFIAVPFYGTLEPWFVFENGIRLGGKGFLGKIASLIGINKITKNLTRNFKSMYEMLPSEEYFSIKAEGSKTEGTPDVVKSVNSYEEMVNAIEKFDWYKKKDKSKKDFILSAKNIKNKWSSGVYRYLAENKNCFFICGTGIDTLYRLGYDKDKNLLISETAPGDYGMIYNSTFPVGTDGSRIYSVNGVKHTKMVNNEEVLNKISEFLKRTLS